MNERIWYLPGAGNQARGPFTAEEVLDKYTRGEIDNRIYVFREGMAQWLPLSAVEPFASRIQELRRLRRRRRMPVLISTVLVLLVLAAIGGGLAAYFFLFREPTEITEARRMIGAGLYAEAEERLSPFLVAHPGDHRALYYKAIAIVNLYATRKSERFVADEEYLLSIAGGYLQMAFHDAVWREKAKSDLAEVPGRVPADAPDAGERLLAVNRLRHELDLAEGQEVARSFLDWLHKMPAAQGAPGWGPWCVQVLKWDPSTADEVLKLTLPAATDSMFDMDRRFSPWFDGIRRLAASNPSAAKPLSLALVNRGDEETKRGKADIEIRKPQDAARCLRRARQMLTVAGEINPHLKADVAQRVDDLDKLIKEELPYRELIDAAQAAMAERRLDQARASLQAALKIGPIDPLALKLLAEVEKGQGEEVRRKDEERRRKEVDNIKSLLAERQAAGALQLVEAAIKKYGPTPELTELQNEATDMLASEHTAKAKTALDRNDLDSAVKACTAALKIAPDRGEARSLLGGAVSKQVDKLVAPAAMEYQKARQAVVAVQALLDDATTKKLLERIGGLEGDPSTTNLIGFWKSKAAAGVIRLDGTDKIITIKVGPDRAQLQPWGSWERNADTLSGTFPGGPGGKPYKATGKVLNPREIQVEAPALKPRTATWTKEE